MEGKQKKKSKKNNYHFCVKWCKYMTRERNSKLLYTLIFIILIILIIIIHIYIIIHIIVLIVVVVVEKKKKRVPQ